MPISSAAFFTPTNPEALVTEALDLRQVLNHATSLLESLRPALTETTRRTRHFNASIWLRLLERELNPQLLEPTQRLESFHAPVRLRETLRDLYDVCLAVAEQWDTPELWQGVLTEITNPRAWSEPSARVLAVLQSAVTRLEGYLAQPLADAALAPQWLRAGVRQSAPAAATPLAPKGESPAETLRHGLLETARQAYAASRDDVVLVAFPSGVRVVRCDRQDPHAYHIHDGQLRLPWGGIAPVGQVTLADAADFAIVAFALPYRDADEMDQFFTFAGQAGAALVAGPPAWAHLTRLADARGTWVAALFFLSPAAARYVVALPGGSRVILQPWAASVATLQDWHTPASARPEPVAPPATPDAAAGANVFRLVGNVWHLAFAGFATTVADLVGLRYLAYLLRHPQRELHVTALLAAVTRKQVVRPLSGLEVLDRQALAEYQAKYEDLCARREEAQRHHDLATQEALQTQIALLGEQLSAATGWGGRPRQAGDGVDKARKAVSNAIQRALEVLRDQHAELARHLERSVQTGRRLCYAPEPPITWLT